MFFKLYRHFRQRFGLFLGVVIPRENCRFTPTCSHYCEQAIQKHGFVYGTLKCVNRVLRCHPLHPGGYDPV